MDKCKLLGCGKERKKEREMKERKKKTILLNLRYKRPLESSVRK